MKHSNLSDLVYRKRVLISLAVLFIIEILVYLAYNQYGHLLISDIYHHKSFSFFNTLITNRHDYSLDHYLIKADRIVNKLHVIIFAIISITIVYALFRKVAFFIGTKVNWIEEQPELHKNAADVVDSISSKRAVYYFFLVWLISILPIFLTIFFPNRFFATVTVS